MEMKISSVLDITIPTIRNYENIAFEKYSLKDLKYISKIYKLKTTMKKEFLLANIKEFLVKNAKAIKIQSMIRKWFVKNWIKSHGPAFYKRDLCVNDSDFLTMEKNDEINMIQFFSYEEEETNEKKFIYGFDIMSVHNLLKKSENPLNPYNRKIFSSETKKQIRKLIVLSKIINIGLDLEIESDIPIEKGFDFRCLDLFQTINELGNYSNHLWFSTLNRRAVTKFIRELNDVWFYRCQLTRETQQKICPQGNPFRNVNFYRLFEDTDDILKNKTLKIMEEMVYSGVDADSRCLGSYYVLGCLTLVNYHAASAMPWLYENFNVIP